MTHVLRAFLGALSVVVIAIGVVERDPVKTLLAVGFMTFFCTQAEENDDE